MTWSLLNGMIAADVEKLVASQDGSYPPSEPRGIDRTNALALIHAVIWAYSSRASSTTAAYAMANLYEALGIDVFRSKFERLDAGGKPVRSEAQPNEPVPNPPPRSGT